MISGQVPRVKTLVPSNRLFIGGWMVHEDVHDLAMVPVNRLPEDTAEVSGKNGGLM